MRDSDETETICPKKDRGRPFVAGNSGRKLGSRNRTTVVAAALLEGETQALVRKAVQRAKAGDTAMLKFLLGRILPRERLVNLDLPKLNVADDAVEVFGQIMRAVSEAKISPGEGAALATLTKAYRDAIDIAYVVKRLDALEAQIRGGLET